MDYLFGWSQINKSLYNYYLENIKRHKSMPFVTFSSVLRDYFEKRITRDERMNFNQ